MQYKPKFYKIVSGTGKGKYPLSAFDNALRDAGIGDYNLVKVSSILPSECMQCEIIPTGKGHILYAAYATATVGYGETAEIAVAVAVPKENEESGVIFETTSFDLESSASNIVEEMCVQAMHNRQKNIETVLKSYKRIVGEIDLFTSAISAVVMW